MIYIFIFRTALACSFVVSKGLLAFVPPFLLAGLRMFIGGSLCLSYVYLFNPSKFYIKKVNLLPILGVIICSGFLTNGLEAWGLSQTIAAKAYFIYNLSPFIAAFLGFLFFHERMSRNKWIGLGLGFLGFLPLIYGDLTSDNILINTLPELAILVAAGSMVLGIVAKKKLVVFQHYSIIMANGLLLFFGGLISLATAFATETISWGSILSHSSL
ncbi:MAG TPA: DMT family transporter, partial [Candidatus Babeliales bacterium]|nr:DMT family transporter [Candidatus Babeliales bacterium]